MSLLNFLNKMNFLKKKEPCKVSYIKQQSRITENLRGEKITETISEEITVEGSSENCSDVFANIGLASRQAEQPLLPTQAEKPVKHLRPMQVVKKVVNE